MTLCLRRNDVIVQELNRETMVYDPLTREFHLLNDIAAFVFNHADGEMTPVDLLAQAPIALGKPVSAQEIEGAIAELDRVRLLDHGTDGLDTAVTRRDVVRRLSAVAVALPFITSILAPTPAMASSHSSKDKKHKEDWKERDKREKEEKEKEEKAKAGKKDSENYEKDSKDSKDKEQETKSRDAQDQEDKAKAEKKQGDDLQALKEALAKEQEEADQAAEEQAAREKAAAEKAAKEKEAKAKSSSGKSKGK